ncbi:hypothetical protein KEM55_002670 [Ascosphaera atra]|nr:hypothetical protein KEM55_002670 [Ascosphaera atra]
MRRPHFSLSPHFPFGLPVVPEAPGTSGATTRSSSNAPLHPQVIPIGSKEKTGDNLSLRIIKGLSRYHQKYLPTEILYDKKGLELFNDITHLKEYYPTMAEYRVLERFANNIVDQLSDGVQLVELGSGGLRKVKILLDAFEKKEKRCTYYALDLDHSCLTNSFGKINWRSYRFVKFAGLHGTYDNGLNWLRYRQNKKDQLCILSLGSSIGNFTQEEAKGFLESFAERLGPNDKMLVGLDSCADGDRVYPAYNDTFGVTHTFYRNGLDHANKIVGHRLFDQDDWEVATIWNNEEHCHEAYYVAKANLRFEQFNIEKGDKVFIERAQKYPNFSFLPLWASAGLVSSAEYSNASADYYVHILSRAGFRFSKIPQQYLPSPVPSLEEFQEVWRSWDTITLNMLPPQALMQKPISLRNNLIFYLGHIPCFTDVHLSRALGEQQLPPTYYTIIFERGIDPDVNDPTVCHSHSIEPDEWPALEEILFYRVCCRERVRAVCERLKKQPDQEVARALWIGFEHEAMHLETFIYMLIHSPDLQVTSSFPVPDFERMAMNDAYTLCAPAWWRIPEQEVTIGTEDTSQLTPTISWTWDNESPVQKLKVSTFEASSRPITNREYVLAMERNPSITQPACWIRLPESRYSVWKNEAVWLHLRTVRVLPPNLARGAKYHEDQPTIDFVSRFEVRTIYGPVPLAYALDWPVMASFDQLSAYASLQGCRIPTLTEVKSIHKKGLYKIPEPPYLVDLTDANVAFSHLHPVNVSKKEYLRGHADFGGVWEWTSSVLERCPGFVPMKEYPGYTADFFDGKHNIVVGGSWATHPRMAGRTSFTNWWQRDYPYTWAGARLVRDPQARNASTAPALEIR